MKNDDFLSFIQKISEPHPDRSLMDYFHIIYRRKWILISAVIILLAAAYLYNKYSTPRYTSYVTLKKDINNNGKSGDQFDHIVAVQSEDKIDTEMKLAKTNEVLSKVVKELKLYLTINKIAVPSSLPEEIQESYINYSHDYLDKNPDSMKYPEFIRADLSLNGDGGQYCLVKETDGTFGLYEGMNYRLIRKTEAKDSVQFNLSNSSFEICWPEALPGSKLFFTIDKYSSAVMKLERRISLEQEGSTNIFRITVESTVPYEAQQIANTVAEKYKETRIDEQKKSIHYSFNFVDQQLKDVSEKLKNAEDVVKQFKSANKLVSMNENSTQIVELLSKLEVEKVNVDLELAEYKNKLKKIQEQYHSKGFFDQTYLTPNKSNDAYSPFSALLLKLSDLEIARIEALNKKKESHPDIIKLDDQIREIKSSLENYNQNTITAYQIIINSLEEKQNKLDKLMRSYGMDLAKLPANETKLAKMLREKNVYEKVFTMLLDKREELRMAELSKLQDVVIIEPAQKPFTATYPKKSFNLFAGGFGGFLLGIIIIAFVEIKNRKKLNLAELESEYSIPIFSIIPNYGKDIKNKIRKSKKLEDRFITLMNSNQGFKETYRVLMSKIFICCGSKAKMLMFSSCEEHTGKTSVVANLGIQMVKTNKNVIMLDCDFKRARLTNMFGLSKNSPGILNAISEKKSLPSIYNVLNFKMNGSVSRLHLLPPGGISENSNALLETDEFRQILSTLINSGYDYILVDTPPVTRVVDALVLAKIVKDAILIVRSDYTLTDSFKWGIKELKQSGAKIHGIVVNACDIQNSSFKHGYGYGYEYPYSYTDEEFGDLKKNSNNGKKNQSTNQKVKT